MKNPYLLKKDITKISVIRRLLKMRSFQFMVTYPNFIIFIIIILTGIFGNQVGNKNLSIIFVWILWWAALMLLLVPLFARLWCTICPLPSAGEWIQRGAIVSKRERGLSLRKKWPKKLDNIWIQNFSFLILSMFIGILITRPWATSYMLILLMLVPVGFFIVFEKRAFCRYVCPVSGFIGIYSNFSALELRVRDREVCRKHTKKDCLTGNENGYGCPWFEFPQHMDRNAYCGLCMECLKTCPKDNTRLYLKLGGEDLYVEPWGGRKERGYDESWKAFIMITLAFFYGLVFMGPYGWLKDMANMTTMQGWAIFAGIVWGSTLVVTPSLYFPFVLLSKKLSRARDIPLKKLFISYSFVLVPMGLMAWIAFSVAILFINGSYIISVISDPFGWGWNLFGTKYYPWTPYFSGVIPIVQIFLILLGLVFSIKAAYKISFRTFENKKQASRAAIPIVIMLTGVTALLLWLWIG